MTTMSKFLDRFGTLENPSITQAKDEIQQKRHAAFADLGNMFVEYAEGAIAGAEEVGRAATQMGATMTPEQIKERMLTGLADTTDMTDEQQASLKYYDKATKTFKDETVRPVMMTAPAFFGTAGFAAMAPFLIESTKEDAEKYGYSTAAKNFVKNAIPLYGTLSDENFGAYAEEHPLRAVGQLAFDAADIIHPSVQMARKVRKNYLMTKGKKSALEAEQIVKGEFDLQETKGTPKETSAEAAPKPQTFMERFNDTEATKSSKPKVTKGLDEVAPAKKPEVTKSIRKNIEDGYKAAQELEDNLQPFRGANGEEVVAAPTSYPHPVTINQILGTANSITPVRLGRLRTNNALGYFEVVGEGIRMKSPRQFDALAHEIGHYLDKTLSIQGHDAELINGVKTGRLANAGYKPNQYRSEGIAEFTATYMLNPEQAQRLYPGYYGAFTKALEGKPNLQKRVDTLSNQIRKWYTQSPEARSRGAMQFEGDTTSTGAFDSLKTKIADKAVEMRDKISQNWLDSFTMMERAIKDYQTATGKKLNFLANPVEMARAVENTIPARTQMLLGISKLPTKYIIDALELVWGIPLKQVTMRDVYTVLDNLNAKPKSKEYLTKHGFKDYHEAFSTYMTALHSLEVVKVKDTQRVQKLQAELELLDQKLKGVKTTSESIPIKERQEAIQGKINDIITGKDRYKTAVDANDYYNVVQNAPADFKVAAKKLADFNHNILMIMVHFDLLSAKQAMAFAKDYPHYVPLKRDFSIEQHGATSSGHTADNYANVQSVIRSLSEKGSERVIKDPLTELMLSVQNIINAGERNTVALRIANMAATEGGSMLAIKARGSTGNAATRVFTVWRNGKKEAWSAVAPGLYEVLTYGDKASNNVLLDAFDKVMKTSATMLRIGATSTPAYTIWNGIKDSLFAGISSQTGTAKTPLHSIGRSLSGLNTYFWQLDKYMIANFEAQGVPFSTFIGSGKNISDELRKMSGAIPAYKKTKAYRGLAAVGNGMLNFNHAVEIAPRYTEFVRALKQGKSYAEAGAMARDLTINFSRSGLQGRTLNRYTAFFNAAVQGTNKVFRMFRQRPKETMLAGITTLTLPTLAYWQMNRDKEWYKDLPFEDKMRYWYWETSPDVILKIPKPELIGYMFASMPEQILNTIYENDRSALDGSSLSGFMVSSTTPNLIPTAALPIVESYFNYSIFRGRDIVSRRELAKEAPDQYNIYTSEVAKGLGKATNSSPMLIDNAMRNLTGSLGSFFLGAVDLMVKEETTPEKKLTDMTRFTLPMGSSRTRTADVFYEGLDKLEKRYNSSNRRDKVREHKGMQKALRDVNKVRKQVNNVLNNKRLSSTEKRERIDQLNKRINNIQRKANQRYLNYKYIQNPNK